jgi:hypothetical protein
MKTIRAALTIVAFALFLAGCAKDTPVDNGNVPDVTDGRITVVNDESKLNTRVTNKNDSVQVDAVGLRKTNGVQAFSMTLVAEIAPPVVNGQTLQATSVSLDNKVAYISYNLRGNTYGGGVDVVQLKSGKNATIVSSATFNDTKVSSVFYDPTTTNIYLAEASSNPSYAYPAVIELMKTQGNKLLLTGNLRTVLTSYVTTSVVVVNNTVYATTGSTGKVYMLSTDSLKISPLSFALADARWVDYDASTITLAALQGGGKMYVFSISPFVLGATYTFTGTSIPESKSTVQVIGGKALIAAGDGGVKLMSLANGKVVGSIPRTIVAGLDSSLSVTNAVSGAGQYIYVSNGEAGVYVIQSDKTLEDRTGDAAVTLTVLGKLRFSTAQSVNHVAFDGSTLVIASGLGGVKIVDVNF